MFVLEVYKTDKLILDFDNIKRTLKIVRQEYCNEKLVKFQSIKKVRKNLSTLID